MTKVNHSLPELLRSIRSELDLVRPGNAGTFKKSGALLSDLAAAIPPDLTPARRLAALVIEAGTICSTPRTAKALAAQALKSISAAINALTGHVQQPDDFGCELLLTQAAQQLLGVLGREPAEWFRPIDVATVAPIAPIANTSGMSPDLALDAAATLIMMVEPDERAEMESIRANLRRFATDELSGALVRALALEAEASLGTVLESIDAGHASRDALDAATECVERTVRARDEEKDQALRLSVEESSAPEVVKAVVVEVPRVPVAIDELPAGDHELIADFLVECREYLASAEGALLRLEVAPDDLEAINTVFRAFHTVKGTSGFLGLHDITNFAHEAESLFSKVRDREIAFAGAVPDLALRALDVVKDLLGEIECGLEGQAMARPDAYAPVLADLARVVAGGDVAVVAAAAPAPVATAADRRPMLVKDDDAPDAPVAREPRTSTAESSIRLSTERLDRLIDMIGELVIAHTMIAQDENVLSSGQHELARKTSHAGKIVRELHDLSLSMRMVPLKPSFQKMMRLVRDVTQNLGKQVDFVTDGEETEIDRNMVDALSDPLVHMVRNAIDHGIETPDAREAAGKPRHGTVRLSAMHAGGSVVVRLRDDGKGLDRERIIEKAISKGLIESAAKMSDSDIFNLIFAPGFSTADKVTDVSGRGVGMDVVRRNIDTLRGRIEIESTQGQGTQFTVRLPLTLAVTDGMLVRVGPERYIIPTTGIFKSFRPEREALSTIAGRGEMVRLHDEILPIFRISTLFNVSSAVHDPCEALIVVVASGDQRVALLVDELLGQQQVVAKSLGDGVGKIEGVSGAAILGDGRIGLILDTGELLQLARQGSHNTNTRAVA